MGDAAARRLQLPMARQGLEGEKREKLQGGFVNYDTLLLHHITIKESEYLIDEEKGLTFHQPHFSAFSGVRIPLHATFVRTWIG